MRPELFQWVRPKLFPVGASEAVSSGCVRSYFQWVRPKLFPVGASEAVSVSASKAVSVSASVSECVLKSNT